ncbi:hypothetical protein ACO22_01957 [Paracoccidioides brasiliensis]|uniref:Uncharacterized protein n=1 Tax=Paracoccidioides brasiliensis TaxID=121759 RepID=A0A1D2JK36_PARBR|nr:hypothetical protein ACO22_01957 [Paracoccidioides brasiliensis]
MDNIMVNYASPSQSHESGLRLTDVQLADLDSTVYLTYNLKISAGMVMEGTPIWQGPEAHLGLIFGHLGTMVVISTIWGDNFFIFKSKTWTRHLMVFPSIQETDQPEMSGLMEYNPNNLTKFPLFSPSSLLRNGLSWWAAATFNHSVEVVLYKK